MGHGLDIAGIKLSFIAKVQFFTDSTDAWKLKRDFQNFFWKRVNVMKRNDIDETEGE